MGYRVLCDVCDKEVKDVAYRVVAFDPMRPFAQPLSSYPVAHWDCLKEWAKKA